MRRLMCCCVVLICLLGLSPVSARAQSCPQDLRAYIPPGQADRLLRTPEQAEMARRRYLEWWYGPWSRSAPRWDAETVAWGFRDYTPANAYGPGQRKRPQSWFDHLRHRAGLENFPNLVRPAVAVATTSQRVLPTDDFLLLTPNQPGQEYPFDELQNSLVHVGTPLLVTHRSADGLWLLVETATTYGWLRRQDVAWVDAALMARCRAAPHGALVQDRAVLRAAGGHWEGRIGMVLPLDEAGQPLLPVAGQPSQGDLPLAALRPVQAPAQAVASFPLVLTPGIMAGLLNQFLGQPYGWGGLYGQRDCSATLQDALAPFAFTLPRNSSQQAWAGRHVPLEHLSVEDKTRYLREDAPPFLTLLWKSGHIMLLVGQCQGQPAIFHSAWSLRASGGEGRTVGRAVVGRLGPESSLLPALRGAAELDRPLFVP